MDTVQEYVITGLATVVIDHRPYSSMVTITLDPSYDGDLRPLEQHNQLPDGVLFSGNDAAAMNHPLLGRFVETLHHWDHDFDGDFDADNVVEHIEAALWSLRTGRQIFKRPCDGLYIGTLMKFMPPAPERHIVMSYGDLKPRFRRWHYAWAVPMVVVFIGLVQLQIMLVPASRHTILSTIGMAAGKFGFIPVLAAVLALWFASRELDKRLFDEPEGTSLARHTFGFFNKAAVSEEQAFREGSEHWTPHQRAMSCVIFGAIHMTNLIYPLATILPLAIGGAIFMHRYLRVYDATRFRRYAVLEASVLHRVYNRVALAVIVVVLSTIAGSLLVGGAIILFSMLLGKSGFMLIGLVRQRRLAEYAS